MVNAKKYVADIHLEGFIIEILDSEQKPIAGVSFNVYVDGVGISMMTNEKGILEVPKPKEEIELSLVGEGGSTTGEEVESTETAPD